MDDRQQSRKQLEIINILAGNFTGLYYVNLKDRTSEVISISDTIKGDTGKLVAQSIDLKEAMDLFINNLVHVDDREELLKYAEYDAVYNLLRNVKEHRILFRRNFNGIYRHTEMLLAKSESVNEEPVNVAIGFEDVEDKYRERKEQDLQKAVVSELANDFEYVCYVSLTAESNEDVAKEYRSDEALERHIPEWKEEKRFTKKLDLLMDRIGYVQDVENFRALTRRNVIVGHLEKEHVYFVNARAVVDGEVEYHQVKFVADRDSEGNLQGFIFGIHSVDEETRRELEFREGVEKLVEIQTEELKQKNHELTKVNENVVTLLGSIVESRDTDSGMHIQRVKRYTYILANRVMKDHPEYGLTPYRVNMITYVSVLHDIGKVKIPDAILLKPGRLTEEEFEVMKTHCDEGCKILEMLLGSWGEDYLKTSTEICRYHHEKWDGNGYPYGLKGDGIPISAQIVSVADCFDALTTKRVYKEAYDPNEAFDMILEGKCGAFSNKLLGSLVRCRAEFCKGVHAIDDFYIDTTSEDFKSMAFDGLKILLVDDDDLTREINKEILEAEGAVVTEATNGAEAIVIVEDSEWFDAILMDSSMPVMDGIEAIRRIRSMIPNKRPNLLIPIIALTSEISENMIIECKDAGANDCISKPLIISELARSLISAMKENTTIVGDQLNETIRIANTDALTQVKNITAYTDKVAELDRKITESSNNELAIVMCDINDLKLENDTYGHDVGDMYIKNCCKIICSVFSHSPVYRIGGDEFVVVLTDIDYKNRDMLMAQMKGMVAAAMKIDSSENGKASFASGMAVYDPYRDKTVGDVVREADMQMYRNKREFEKA